VRRNGIVEHLAEAARKRIEQVHETLEPAIIGNRGSRSSWPTKSNAIDVYTQKAPIPSSERVTWGESYRHGSLGFTPREAPGWYSEEIKSFVINLLRQMAAMLRDKMAG
jgi:hypothetical protein